MRRPILLALAALAVAVPAAARAAEMKAGRGCYRDGQQIRLSGGGFTPAGHVTISLNGQPFGSTDADGKGEFDAVGTPPSITGPVQTMHVVATDVANPATHAETTFKITKLS